MLEPLQIVETESRPVAVVHLVVPRTEVQTVMFGAIDEVHRVLAAQEISPASPVFTHHLRMDPLVFDFEVGVAVATPVEATGRVLTSQLPETTVARTVYHGPYEQLGQAWSEFDALLAAQGYTLGEDLWECYLAPGQGSDASELRTELNRPIARG
jgi:effector-binding domain-containing protein